MAIVAGFVLITLLGGAILVYLNENVTDQVTQNFTSFSDDSEATLELRGSIVAKATNNGDAIDEIVLHVSNGLGIGYVDMTPGVALLRYIDADQTTTFGKDGFSVRGLGNADDDTLVEPKESSGPHHQDSGEAKIRESTAGVSRKPSSDGKARGCSSKHLCGLTAWNTRPGDR